MSKREFIIQYYVDGKAGNDEAVVFDDGAIFMKLCSPAGKRQCTDEFRKLGFQLKRWNSRTWGFETVATHKALK